MSPVYRHWLEKLQVKLTAGAALAVAWFACWHLIKPWDFEGALAFVPGGEFGRLAAYAGVIWAISFGCAVFTLSAPAEGALLAALVGAVGLSLRGGPMRALLWRWESRPGQLFSLLALELLLLGAILAGAVIVIALTRAAARRICPKWLWVEPKPKDKPEDPQQRRADAPREVDPRGFLAYLRLRGRPGAGRPAQAAGCLAMELALAVILLVFSFRSTDRGQIAFALAGSFFVAALVADHVFPVRSPVAVWIGPILIGVVVFLLGRGAGAGDELLWRNALTVARGLPLRAALPADWLAWGCGGAVAGFWLSRRLHFATLRKQEPATKKATS